MSLIGVIEKKIPDISDKTKELLELFNDESLKGLSNNELKDFFEGLDGADEDFMKFVDKFDSSKDVFEQYQQHMIDNGKATSTFSSITKKAGTAIKSIGASLASMGVMWLVGEAISLVVKGIDNYIHRVEKAQEAIDDSRSEYEEATSSIESMNSELETTKQRIEELESKGKLTFTEKAELENLKEQNSELERSIALEEKKQKTKANQTVNKIRQKKDTLSEDFEDVFDNYSRYKKEYEKTKQIGLEGLTSGTITQESFDATMTGMDSQLNQYESEILDKIEKFEQYKQDIINKYGTNDISKFSVSDKNLYNDIVSQLQDVYKTFYSDAEYNKFVIEPIFDTEELNGLEDKLLAYFSTQGSLDTTQLSKVFGANIITALRKACEQAGIDFDEMIQNLYDNATNKLNQIAPITKTPNSSYDAQQNNNSKSKREYFDSLENSDKELLLNAEIPDSVKNGTVKELESFLKELKNKAKENPVEVTFSSEADSLKTLADEISNVQTAYNEFKESGFSNIDTLGGIAEGFKDLDSYKKFVKVAGDAKSSANDIQKSFNNLVTEYIYTKGAIDNLTSSTVGLCETQLKAQGITNAHEIVTSDYAQAIIFANENGIDLTNTTWEEISALAQQQGVTENVRQALGLMAIEKWKASNTGITNLQDLLYLEQIAISAGIAIEGLQGFANAKAALSGDIPGITTDAAGKYATQQINSEIEKIKAKYDDANYKPKANYSAPKTSNKNYSNKDKNKSKKDTDTKQEIDWIARRLERLQKVIDATKTKFENLFKLKSKSNNLEKQITQTETLLKAEEKAADKYAKKAKSYANSTKYTSGKNKGKQILSNSFLKQIQEGKINGSVNDLIKEYGSEKASAIQKYQDYWDKFKDAKQKVDELTTSIRKLKEEKYQLYVDDAQAKIDKSNAWMALDSGNYKEQNKHLEAQKKYLQKSYDYQIKIAKLNKDKDKESQLKAEYEQKLREIESQKFENIKNQYENEQSLMQYQEDSISRQIELIQARGDMLDQYKYKDQIAIEQQKISSYKAEQSLLENQLKNITVGTDEWYEANSALESVKANIDDANKSISDMVKNINQIGETLRTKITDSFERVKTESDWITELMSEIEDFDDQTHTVTNEGITRLGSYMTGMTVSEYQSDLIQEWIKELSSNKDGNGEAHFTSAITGTEINYTAEEFENAWKDAYDKLRTYDSEYMDYKNKAIEWEISKLNAQLSIMQDIVQSRKDALNAEKDLHDYQQSIQNSTQNIGLLQKQIAASIGDTSEEGIARTQKLQKELSDAQNDLKETEYDRYISDQEELLDKMMEEYEDLVNSESKQREALFNKAIQDADNNTKTITDTNIKYADDLGYKFETGIYKIGNVNDTISTTVGSILTELRNGIVVSNLPQANDSQSGQSAAPTAGSTGSTNPPTTQTGTEVETTRQVTSQIVNKMYGMTKSEVSKFVKDNGKTPTKGHSYQPVNAKLKSAYGKVLTEENLKKLSKKLGITYDNSQKNGNLYIALKDLGIKGFSKGGMVSELQKVATANGDEAWATVKRGEDILTPLQSKVFNEEFIPRMDLMMDSAKVLDNIVKNSSFVGNIRSQSPINVEQNITLDLKEVNDPKTLVRFVQTDPTFKKVLSSVTIDQLGNSSRLDVNKYR